MYEADSTKMKRSHTCPSCHFVIWLCHVRGGYVLHTTSVAVWNVLFEWVLSTSSSRGRPWWLLISPDAHSCTLQKRPTPNAQPQAPPNVSVFLWLENFPAVRNAEREIVSRLGRFVALLPTGLLPLTCSQWICLRLHHFLSWWNFFHKKISSRVKNVGGPKRSSPPNFAERPVNRMRVGFIDSCKDKHDSIGQQKTRKSITGRLFIMLWNAIWKR